MNQIRVCANDVVREGFEMPVRLEKDIRGAYSRLNLNAEDIRICFSSCITHPPAASHETSIYGHTTGYLNLPYYFLIDPSDIDAKYKKENLSDAELEKFFNESRTRFGLPKEEFTFKHKMATGLFLVICRNETLARKAKLFVIGHELGHVKHQHANEYPEFFSKRNFLMYLGFVILGIGLALTLHHFCPFSSLKATILNVGLGGGSAATFVVVTALNIHNFKRCTKDEAEADKTHATLSQEARDGGIYLFETTTKYFKETRGSSWLLRLLTTEDGDKRFNFTHPSFTARKKALEDQKVAAKDTTKDTTPPPIRGVSMFPREYLPGTD